MVEGACKTAIGKRLKQTGARWRHRRVERMASLCCLAYGEHRINNLLALPPGVPTPRNLHYRRAVRTIDGVVYRIISERRLAPERDAGDLLSMLMAARDEETGEGLSDRELRNQLFTFIAAGHETTAVALAWTVYLLDRHPEAGRRLRGPERGVARKQRLSARADADMRRWIETAALNG